MAHHIIYVPGLGDDSHKIQSLAAASWRLYGVHGHCHPMPWAGPGDYLPKFESLLMQIDELSARGHTISLLGASAGASAVLNAFVVRRDKIHSLAYICGKINQPDTVGEDRYRKNPAYRVSMQELQLSLQMLTEADKQKITSFYSPADGTVGYEDTVITGVHEVMLPKLLHAWAILYCLTFGFSNVKPYLSKI